MVTVRKADSGEGAALTALAMRSKAHWGYPEAFMKAFAPELVITEDYISAAPVLVAVSGDQVVGFAGLSAAGTPAELIFLFVEPSFIGKGCGELLWGKVLEEARLLKWDSFAIISDPHAERFYLKRGAVKVGEKSFPSAPGRLVPVLRYGL